MKDIIAELITKKPHLADPLRFYEKTLGFIRSVHELPLSVAPDENAYTPGIVPDVFERFSALFDLPEGTLSPLKQAMELREVDFTRLPFGEVPSFSLPYAEDNLSMLLYLLSKPWFLALVAHTPAKGQGWNEGKCPVCNAQPVVTWMADNRREAFCAFCGTTGSVARTGMPRMPEYRGFQTERARLRRGGRLLDHHLRCVSFLCERAGSRHAGEGFERDR